MTLTPEQITAWEQYEADDDTDESGLDYETTYGHCLAKNPYWFIPDLECNTEAELLSWRHALLAVRQDTFETPEHYFWKVADVQPSELEISKMVNDCGVVLMESMENGKIIMHGHNTPWGMGISALSGKVNVWEQYPCYKWILDFAESNVLDNDFLAGIKKHFEYRKRKRV